MTVDTVVVKIVDSEKPGFMMMNVGVNAVCNGYVKVGEFSVKVNGDVENGVKVCVEDLKDDKESNVVEDSVEENGEIKSEIEVAEAETGDSIRVLEVKEVNDSEPVVDEVQDAEQSPDAISLDAEDKRSLFDDAISADKSYDCQQHNLQPDDGEDDKQDLIEIEAKTDEIGEADPVARSEESVDSETVGCDLDQDEKGADITDRICLEPFSKPEETPDFQSEGACNQGNLLNLEPLGVKNPVSVAVDDSTMDSVESKVTEDVSSVPDNSASGFTEEDKQETETKNGEIDMAITSNNISDGTLGSKFSFGSFDCIPSFSHADINLQSDENKQGTKTKNGEIDMAIESNNRSDGTVASNFSFGSFECVASFSPSDINLPSDANSSEHKLNPDSLANDGDSDRLNRVYWMVKIPRADVRIYDEQIQQSEIELAEKTKTRNAFQAKANQQQAYCRELRIILEAAKVEAKAAHELARSKKKEVDFNHSLINRAKNGVTIEDLDSKIHSLEYALQHETRNIREEKELVREIRQLNHQRQLLFANPQQQQEIQHARNQRDHAQEQLKVLKKEMEALRDNFVKADEHARAARKKYDDESAVLNDLKFQVRSSNDIRQEAYVHVRALKEQRNQKNAAFYQGKNDLRIAYNYAAEGKMDSLERHCANQVETFMEMWNKNDEFRKEYIQCSMRRRLWKQGLLNETRPVSEVPPSLEKSSDDGVNASIKVDSPTTVLTMERDLSIEGKVTKDKSSEKVEHTKTSPVAIKKEAMSEDEVPKLSNRIEIEEYKEEPKLTYEEDELTKKANQLKREKEAAQLREQRRLEEKAKAEEALERKRRSALKAQARAEFKAQKEAEQKEKEREKRAKKKEKKRGLNPETPPEDEPAKPPEPLSESLNEPEAVEKPVTVAKRSVKASTHRKHVKLSKPIPVALRNKGKRGLLRYWPYACIVLIATVLFFVGNFERVETIKQHISGLLHRL